MLKHLLNKNNKLQTKKYLFVYGMILFAVIHFIIFYLCINLNSILMGFKVFNGYDENGREILVWSGRNFKRLLIELGLENSDARVSLFNTLKYFGTNIVFLLPVSLFVAYFLYKKVPMYKFFRVLFFLPSIISAVVFVTVFKNIIQKYGPIYEMLKIMFNYELPPLLSQASTATPTIIFYTVWTGFGVNVLLYQSAMKRIPEEIIEVGKLEGISWIRELGQVLLPMVWPTFSTTLLLQLTGLFNSTGPILLFSQAGSIGGGGKTNTLSYWIYSMTYDGYNYNYPAAVGIFFTAISFPIVLIARFVLNKIDPDIEY